MTIEVSRAILKELGKAKDIDLAKKYNISRERVRQLRIIEGIKPYKEINPLYRTGLSPEQFTQLENELATIPVAELAIKYNVSSAYICRLRQKNKVTSRIYRELKKIPSTKIEEFKNLLGKVHDSVLAKKYGISASYVGVIRKKLNIPKVAKK